jgi:26S proteasome regulatory subunit N1
MTYAEEGQREALKYRMLGTGEPVGAWGHEYVRYPLQLLAISRHRHLHSISHCGPVSHLAAEIIAEQGVRLSNELPADDLLDIVDQIVPFCLSHNAEADACDLLIEIEQLDRLVSHVDTNTYQRVCLYLLA